MLVHKLPLSKEAQKADLLNKALIGGLTGLDKDMTEIEIDILTVVANKPVNYQHLKDIDHRTLRSLASQYVRTRHPGNNVYNMEACLRKIESIFEESGVDLLSLVGLQVPPTELHLSGASLYYAMEGHLQRIVSDLFATNILASIKSLAESRSSVERGVFKAWMSMMLKRSPDDPRTITISADEFSHHYQAEVNQELPTSLDAKAISEMLARGRLAYPVNSAVCRMWYIYKDWVQESIKHIWK